MVHKREKPRVDFMRKNSADSPKMQAVDLPRPALSRSTSVARALRQRRTIREISGRTLSLQVLSNLLWAACGINRKKVAIGISGRTVASASNSQEIDLYVALPGGTFLYDASHHKLVPIFSGDLRHLALGKGQPDSGAKAPVRLIYVADVNKLINTSGHKEPGLKDHEIQKSYYYVDTGMIAANVYMFAASAGLATWFHNCDRSGLKAKLKLRADQHVLFSQTVGYPVKD